MDSKNNRGVINHRERARQINDFRNLLYGSMDVREKLVELIESARYWSSSTSEEIADNLIVNNATVHDWISVDERIPENFISVLGYMTDAGEFPSVRECYTVGNAFFFPALGDVHPVSHWCEMPQPPKGE